MTTKTPLVDDEAREKAKEARARTTAAINCRELKRRRREAGEIASRKVSIQNFCRECMGFDSGDSGSLTGAVRACPARECWLWPWRNGKLDVEA